MKMNRTVKLRWASVFMSVTMLVTGFALPISAYADEVPKGYTEIAAAEDLELLRTDPFGKFILTDDIDLSETRRGGSMDSGHGWTPIEKFGGTFDGNGHTISDMTIYGDVRKAGLFANNLGTITNVHLTDVNIEVTTDLTDDVNVGALCGYTTHDIDLCSATGTVRAAVLVTSADNHDLCVGGLVGRSEAKIEKSYSNTAVEYCVYAEQGETVVNNFLSPHIGGLAGVASSINSYNRGLIRGVSYRSFFDISGSFADFNVPKEDLHIGGISAGGSSERCVNFSDGGITGYSTNDAWYCYYAACSFGYPGNRGSSIPTTSDPEPIYDGLDHAVWENIGGTLQLIDNPEIRPINVSFKTQPTKTEFRPGEDFACDGVLSVEYDNGAYDEVEITPAMVGGYDLETEGVQTAVVTYKGFELTYDITVSSISAASILLDTYTAEMNRGETLQLTATISPPDAASGVEWTTSDSSVAVVDQNGLVTAVAAGSTEITAQTDNGLKAVCALDVYVPATAIYFDEKTITINYGEPTQLTPKFEPPDAAPKLVWTTQYEGGNTPPYTLDPNGVITGTDVGRTGKFKVSTVKTGKIDPFDYSVAPYTEVHVYVANHAQQLALSNEKLNVDVGQEFEVSCRAIPENMTDTLSWTFTENIMTETGKGGKGNTSWIRLKADRPGECVLTAQCSNGKEVSCEITITKADVADAVITPEFKRALYDGDEKTPYLSCAYNGGYINEGTDYTVTYSNNVNVGIATATIHGINNFTGQKSVKFLIYDISYCSMTLESNFYLYDGLAKRPAVTVFDDGRTLREGTDYVVDYSKNVSPGTATATVTGINSYTGKKSMNFTISREDRVDLSACNITLDPTSFIYDGGEKRPVIIAYNGHNKLIKDNDFLVTYYDNIKIGTARAVVEGIGSYTGTKELNYTIMSAPQKDFSQLTATLSQTSYIYDGTAKTPSVTVKNGALTLTQGSDYTVAYSNNVDPGNAVVTVTGTGNYSGSKTLTFTIKEKEPEPQPQGRRFTWGRDNWNFLNTYRTGHFKEDKYSAMINSVYVNALKENLSASEYETIFNGTQYGGPWIEEKFGGSCYGMSSTTLLSLQGFLPFDQYQSGATRLHDLDYPAKNPLDYQTSTSNVSSLITYYQMLQVKDVTQQKYRTYPKRSHEDNIKEIITLLDSNDTVLIGFRKTGWGGHAILAYDYEYGTFSKNGVTYQGRIKICDPNSSTTDDENYYIYFTTSNYAWAIPAYSGGGITSGQGAVFNYVGADIDTINMGGYLSGSAGSGVSNYVARMDVYSVSQERSVTKVEENKGGYVMMNNSPGDIEEDYTYVLGNESEGLLGYNLYDPDAAYRVVQTDASPLELTMTYEDCMMTAGTQSGRSITFDRSGVVEIKGDASQYAISMTHDEGSPTDWFTVKVSGDGAQEMSLKKAENGWIVSGDVLDDVAVKANNKYSEASTTFTTEYDSALIYEIDQDTIGIAIDADSNGTYETTIMPPPEEIPVIDTDDTDSDDTDTDSDSDGDKGIVGDVDGDGDITSSDALVLLRMSVGLEAYDASVLPIADIDGDNSVTSSDALDLLRHSVGLPVNDRIGKKAA